MIPIGTEDVVTLILFLSYAYACRSEQTLSLCVLYTDNGHQSKAGLELVWH